MGRETGTFEFAANFEVKKDGTLDARQIVDNFADLLAFTSDNYIPNGFPVGVRGVETPAERGLYVCMDAGNMDVPASWMRLGTTKTLAEILSANTSAGGKKITSLASPDIETDGDAVNVKTLKSYAIEKTLAEEVALKNGSSLPMFENPTFDDSATAYASAEELNLAGYDLANGYGKGTQIYMLRLADVTHYIKASDADTDWFVWKNSTKIWEALPIELTQQ